MPIDPSVHLELVREHQRDLSERMSAPARELAQRRSGQEEVLLLWHPTNDRVELSVRDLTSGASLRIDVAPADAIDAFYHPYAYLASRERSDQRLSTIATIDDE